MHLGSDLPALSLLREVGWKDDVSDEGAGLQPGIAVGLRDGRGLDQGGVAESVGHRRPERARVLVGDADVRHGRRAANQVAEQAEDHDRGDEQQRDGAAVAAESLQQATGDRADAMAAHDSFLPASARKASSRFCDPPCARISVGEPSASKRPYWMRPSRWQRSASSMTWLEMMSVVPSAAMRRK